MYQHCSIKFIATRTHHFRRVILEIPGEPFVQPQVIPPRTGHHISKPLVAAKFLDQHYRLLFEFHFCIVVEQHVFLSAMKNQNTHTNTNVKRTLLIILKPYWTTIIIVYIPVSVYSPVFHSVPVKVGYRQKVHFF